MVKRVTTETEVTEDGLTFIRTKIKDRLWAEVKAHAITGGYNNVGEVCEEAFREYLTVRKSPDFRRFREAAKAVGMDLPEWIERTLRAAVGE